MRRARFSSRVSDVDVTPVACSSRRAVTAATAAPVTGRPCAVQTFAAAASAAVFPAPAGPTTTASPSAPASAATIACCSSDSDASGRGRFDELAAARPGGQRAQLAGEAQRGLFDTEQLGGGPPRPVRGAGGEPDGVAAGQDLVGGGLERACGPTARSGRQGLAQCLQQVAPVEPGGLRGESRWAEQLRRELSDRRHRRWPREAEDVRDHLRGVVAGGASTSGPPLTQCRLRSRIGLGGAGGQARGLGGVRPGRAGLAHAARIWRRRVENVASRSVGRPATSAIPLTGAVQVMPRRSVSCARSTAWYTYEAVSALR